MLYKQVTSDEVAQKLHKLTSASRLAQHGDCMETRLLGEKAYNLTYVWLEQHGVPFMYNEDQECYVEDCRDE